MFIVVSTNFFDLPQVKFSGAEYKFIRKKGIQFFVSEVQGIKKLSFFFFAIMEEGLYIVFFGGGICPPPPPPTAYFARCRRKCFFTDTSKQSK